MTAAHIGDLKPDPKNARKHTPRNVGQIERSMQANGFGRSILLANDGTIIAGNATAEAAGSIGLEDLIIVQSDGTKVIAVQRTDVAPGSKQALELGIADNRSAELAEWDTDVLAGLGDEIDLTQFFMQDELDALLASLTPTEGLTDPDDVPSVPTEPITKPGDLWLLGRHRLLCGDATVVTDVDRLMGGEKADMVFTDPPYNLAYQSGTWSAERKAKMRLIENDNMDDETFIQFLTDALALAASFNTGDQYVCSDWKVFHLFREAILRTGQRLANVIVWNKLYQTQALNKFANAHELILFTGNNGHPYKDINVWDCKREFDADHPTPKPVELVAKAIGYSSNVNALVLDLFGGSGSTLIACEQTNRRCAMMELDPHYCDVILQRFFKFSGISPVRDDGYVWAQEGIAA